MKIIQNSLNIKFSKEISEDEILKVMLKKDSLLPREMIIHIREKISEIVRSIELELKSVIIACYNYID